MYLRCISLQVGVLMYLCYISLQVGVPMPDSDTVPMSGRPDPNSVELLQHINAMLDSPLDLSEGLPRGSPGDGEIRCFTDDCYSVFQ
jgi:hypothetical protein